MVGHGVTLLIVANCSAPAFGAAAQTPAAAPVPAAAASAEVLGLARRVAAHDDFLALAKSAGTAQVLSIEVDLGEMTLAEKARVEQIAAAKLSAGLDRVTDNLAKAYAAKFTADELKGMAAFLETPAGGAYSQRLIAVLPALSEGMKGFDFKREVLAQTCAELNKGCPPAAPKP